MQVIHHFTKAKSSQHPFNPNAASMIPMKTLLLRIEMHSRLTEIHLHDEFQLIKYGTSCKADGYLYSFFSTPPDYETGRVGEWPRKELNQG